MSAKTSGPSSGRYALAADGVAMSHALFVAFVVWGELLILLGLALGWEWVYNVPFRIVHLGLVGFVFVQDMLGRICPLTIWERQFRQKAGQSADNTPFIGRMVHRFLMCHLSERTQRVLRMLFAMVVILTFLIASPHFVKPE